MLNEEITMKIKMDFEEKADEFIFYTLSNWLGQQEVCRVNKEELLEAMKKQTPKKPYTSIQADWHCSVCGDVVSILHAYCPYCGQKLDWSEE